MKDTEGLAVKLARNEFKAWDRSEIPDEARTYKEKDMRHFSVSKMNEQTKKWARYYKWTWQLRLA